MSADTRRVSSRTRKSSVAKAVPVPADESRPSIKIIRREVVAEIVDDPTSSTPALRAAFMAASDYIAEEVGNTGRPLGVEFQYGGGTFRLGFEVSSDASADVNLNDVSDERLAEACRNRGMDVYSA
jgi:hypothetical protein